MEVFKDYVRYLVVEVSWCSGRVGGFPNICRCAIVSESRAVGSGCIAVMNVIVVYTLLTY
jgi:hypothetical protein